MPKIKKKPKALKENTPLPYQVAAIKQVKRTDTKNGYTKVVNGDSTTRQRPSTKSKPLPPPWAKFAGMLKNDPDARHVEEIIAEKRADWCP